MGKVIEFYVPDSLRNLPPEVPREKRGKVIVFQPRVVILGEMESNKSQPLARVRDKSDSRR